MPKPRQCSACARESTATQLDIPLPGAPECDALHYWAESSAESRGEAQYLRRIRLPLWSKLSTEQQTSLKSAADSNDTALIDATVRGTYGLDKKDWDALIMDSSAEMV